MAAIYIPGWADQLIASGLPQQFGGILANKFNPQGVANRKFQELVQQNPGIMEQLSNMPEEQRSAYFSGLGFKTPPADIMKMPAGPKLKAQQDEQAFVDKLTPELRTSYEFISRGMKSPEEQAYDTQLRALNIKKLTNDVDLQEILDGERKRAIAKINELRTKFPEIDVRGVVNRVVNNSLRPDDLPQLQVLQNDMGDALKVIMDMSTFRQKTNLEMMMRGRANEDDMWRVAMSSVESARKEYNDAMKAQQDFFRINRIAQVSPEFLKENPELGVVYQGITQRLNEAETRFKSLYPATKKYMSRIGVELPDLNVVTPPPAAVPPGTETPEQRRARIKRAAGGM